MASYFLDTNICIYIIKRSPVQVFRELKKHHVGDIAISSITYSELQFGISKRHPDYREENQSLLNQFLAPIEILDYPKEASFLYGEIRVHLESKGRTIGNLDMLIAAHALHHHATLVTNNLKEFSRVAGLKTENWV